MTDALFQPIQLGSLSLKNRIVMPPMTRSRELALAKGECDPELSKLAGGLRYVEMKEAAEQADFRQALWQMGEIIADLFERLVETQERLQELPTSDGPDWETLTRRWRA